MKQSNTNILIQSSIDNIYDKIYNRNADIFSSFYNIIKCETSDWEIHKTHKERKVILYMFMDSLPDDFVKYTVENDKYLKLKIKNKIVMDTPQHKIIKTKIHIINLNPILKTIINKLKLIKIHNTIEIISVNEYETQANIKTKSQIFFQSEDLEEYVIQLIDNIINSSLKLF